MLELREEDFAEEIDDKSGVLFWLEKIPGIRNPVSAISWPDLIILRPDLDLPDSIAKMVTRKRLRSVASVLVTWNKKTLRYATLDGVAVPDIEFVHSLEAESLQTVEPESFDRKRKPRWAFWHGMKFSMTAVKRCIDALDVAKDEFELRYSDSEIGPFICMFIDGDLYAIIGCMKAGPVE